MSENDTTSFSVTLSEPDEEEGGVGLENTLSKDVITPAESRLAIPARPQSLSSPSIQAIVQVFVQVSSSAIITTETSINQYGHSVYIININRARPVVQPPTEHDRLVVKVLDWQQKYMEAMANEGNRVIFAGPQRYVDSLKRVLAEDRENAMKSVSS